MSWWATAIGRRQTSQELTRAIAERDRGLQEQARALTDREATIRGLTAAAEHRDRQIEELTRLIAERDRLIHELTRAADNRERTLQDLVQVLADRGRPIRKLPPAIADGERAAEPLPEFFEASIEAAPENLGAAYAALDRPVASDRVGRADAEQDRLYLALELVLRGSEDVIARQQALYLPSLAIPEPNRQYPLLDVGCGRGEFLGLLKQRASRPSASTPTRCTCAIWSRTASRSTSGTRSST